MFQDREKLTWIYKKMKLIREFENRVSEEFAAGNIPGFVHLYAGEEAVAVGVCAHLRDCDFITSTHRGHGHCIAKGLDIKKMMAEIFGRETGICRGKGGSMHIADLSKGMLGANPVVGAGLPQACGPALVAKVKKTNQVAACFFGDGASNQGTFHESLNLAAIWKLPVIFVVENNLYAQSTPQEYHQTIKDIYIRATAYNIASAVADGSDVFDVYEKAGEAVRRAKAGQGPTLFEVKTYRYYGHFEGDAMSYRTREEAMKHREEKDCINFFRKKVLKESLLTQAELDKIDSEVLSELEEAVRFAKESPWPKPEEALEDVYVSY